MHLIRKFFSAFFHYHFFIALVAVAMSIETCILLNLPVQSVYFYLFVFFSTNFAYNIYYIKTPNAKQYLLMSVLALTGALSMFFFLEHKSMIKVFFISIASVMYIFPVFFSFKKDKSFTLQKLLLLTFVWVAVTFILPAPVLSLKYSTVLYLLHRIVFLLFSCMLFFIRDEPNAKIRKKANSFMPILICFQTVLSMSILFTTHTIIGAVFVFISLLCIPLHIFFHKKKRENLHYLIMADGILFLQSIIVILVHTTYLFL